MPTGPKHSRFDEAGVAVDCRYMSGEDHGEDSASESLSVYGAVSIWMSKGMDEDYTFGFDESDLRRAAGVE